MTDVLLDEEQSDTGLPQAIERLIDPRRDDGREAEGQLIGDQHLGHLDHDPGHRQHALLATGQRSGDLAPAIAQRREEVVGGVQSPPHSPTPERLAEGEHEVLLHGQRGEHGASLGRVGDPGAGEPVGPGPGQVGAVDDARGRRWA